MTVSKARETNSTWPSPHPTKSPNALDLFLDEMFSDFDRVWHGFQPQLVEQQVGTVRYVGHGIARVEGLPGARLEELIQFPDGLLGMVHNIDPQEIGVVLLGDSVHMRSGDDAFRTGRVMDIPVGRALLGRVINATGVPLDGLGSLQTKQRLPIERPAPAILQRAPVSVPLQTGLKVIDALLPIGRGQRELILGDRQTGKSAIALDAIINQRHTNVLCIYCAIGQRNAAVAKIVADLRAHHALRYTVVVVASGEEPPGLQFAAPYAATTIGEHFMQQGMDVLIVYDDLTQHARAYRTLSLLLRRPPGREAYPGDIFYIHSRLLERCTHLKAQDGGGSLTALPIVETHAQDVSAYIPTNLISITDGQIYLSPGLFQKGIRPAVDVGRSVSRVGSKAQLPAYRTIAGRLRLTYSQFEELELFSRFSTRLDESSRHTLERGRRLRHILQQPQYHPLDVPQQIAALLAVTTGIFDAVPLERMRAAEEAVQRVMRDELADLCLRIEAGDALTRQDREQFLDAARKAVPRFSDDSGNADD